MGFLHIGHLFTTFVGALGIPCHAVFSHDPEISGGSGIELGFHTLGPNGVFSCFTKEHARVARLAFDGIPAPLKLKDKVFVLSLRLDISIGITPTDHDAVFNLPNV